MPFRLRLLLLCSFVYSAIVAQPRIEQASIDTLVQQWNRSHNSKDIASLKQLFAGTVLFYGRPRAKATVLATKTRLLKVPFQQDIVSPVELTYYQSGTVKASFTKRVTTDGTVQDYPAYLLIAMVDGQPAITGESDAQTDEKRGFALELGPEEKSSSGLAVWWLAGFALLAAIAVYKYLQKRKNNNTPEATDATLEEPLPVEQTKNSFTNREPYSKPVARQQWQPFSRSAKNPEYEKGLAFEKWVVERFNRDCFELIEWRSDKMHNGMYAKASKLPDLEFSITTKQVHIRFAIECKYRSNFYYGKVEIARQDQLIQYKEFEELSGKPVFIVLGVGGKPHNPEHVFVIPLRQLYHHELHLSQLEPFRRYKTTGFYYNTFTNMLE